MNGTLQLLDDTPPYSGNIFTGDIYISPIKLFVALVSHSTYTTFKGNASVAVIATIQRACAVIVSFPDLSMVHGLGMSLVFSSILPSEKRQCCWFTCRLENITYCKTTKSCLAPSLKHRSIHPTDVTFYSSLVHFREKSLLRNWHATNSGSKWPPIASDYKCILNLWTYTAQLKPLTT